LARLRIGPKLVGVDAVRNQLKAAGTIAQADVIVGTRLRIGDH
jgi:hypothetical protein